MERRKIAGISVSPGLPRLYGFSADLAEVFYAAIIGSPVHSSDLWPGDNLFEGNIQIASRIVAVHAGPTLDRGTGSVWSARECFPVDQPCQFNLLCNHRENAFSVAASRHWCGASLAIDPTPLTLPPSAGHQPRWTHTLHSLPFGSLTRRIERHPME